MGTRYSSQATAGYNSSAPADDGSQTAANLITWAGIKTKLADVLKTFGEAINTALVAAFAYDVRQITTSDSVVAGDHMRIVEIAPTATTGVTVTLADAATMTSNFRVWIKNSSPHQQTIARATGGDTIEGTAANITIPAKASYMLQTTTGANGYLIADVYPLEITNLTEEGSVPADSDTVAFYDLSATALRKFQARYLRMQAATEQATTSGTSVDLTSIPSWAKQITVNFEGVSTNGTALVRVQLGDSGGIETTNYLGAAASLASAVVSTISLSAGFDINISAANAIRRGAITLTKMSTTSNTWTCSGSVADETTVTVSTVSGSKQTSAALDRIRITTSNGTDTFDNGSVNISYI